MGIKLVKAKDNSAHFNRGELYKVIMGIKGGNKNGTNY